MVGNDVTDKLKSRYFEDFIKSFNKPNEFDTPYTLALCNPTFTYPHIVKTKSSSTERTISLKNENSISETSYDRDMIGFHWNYKRKQFDIIQAVIMNCNFNEVEPTTINSATLLGHGYVEKDKYLTQINETFTQDQIDTPGIFEHIYNTT